APFAHLAVAAHRVGLLDDTLRRLHRQPTGHEEVAGIALGHLEQVALAAEALDVLPEHDLHDVSSVSSPSPTATATASGASSVSASPLSPASNVSSAGAASSSGASGAPPPSAVGGGELGGPGGIA